MLFPGRQETKLPCLGPPALLGVLLCICFPVANITARHDRDCRTAHPKQLLNISESRAWILPAALRSSQHPAPNYKCRWQPSAGRDRGYPHSRAAGRSKDPRCPATKCCRSPSTPRDNPSTSPEKPGEERGHKAEMPA